MNYKFREFKENYGSHPTVCGFTEIIKRKKIQLNTVNVCNHKYRAKSDVIDTQVLNKIKKLKINCMDEIYVDCGNYTRGKQMIVACLLKYQPKYKYTVHLYYGWKKGEEYDLQTIQVA